MLTFRWVEGTTCVCMCCLFLVEKTHIKAHMPIFFLAKRNSHAHILVCVCVCVCVRRSACVTCETVPALGQRAVTAAAGNGAACRCTTASTAMEAATPVRTIAEQSGLCWCCFRAAPHRQQHLLHMTPRAAPEHGS